MKKGERICQICKERLAETTCTRTSRKVYPKNKFGTQAVVCYFKEIPVCPECYLTNVKGKKLGKAKAG